MGIYGMKITQSDQYCEIYERFMTEYDEGKPLSEIKSDILNEYIETFENDSGILHDVYFAIGKAEWMCGGISDDIYKKIEHIVNNSENIVFLRELGASESDLNLRKKNLDKFLYSLSIPRGKTKKRKSSTEKYSKIDKPKLPIFLSGDVFAYRINEKYRVLVFTSRTMIYRVSYASFCYVWGNFFEQIPTLEELISESVLPIGYFTANNFFDIKELIYLGNNSDLKRLDVALPAIYTPWKQARYAIDQKHLLEEKIPPSLGMQINDGIKMIKEFWRD